MTNNPKQINKLCLTRQIAKAFLITTFPAVPHFATCDQHLVSCVLVAKQPEKHLCLLSLLELAEATDVMSSSPQSGVHSARSLEHEPKPITEFTQNQNANSTNKYKRTLEAERQMGC